MLQIKTQWMGPMLLAALIPFMAHAKEVARVEQIIEEERQREKSYFEMQEDKKKWDLERQNDIMDLKKQRDIYLDEMEEARRGFKTPETSFDYEAYLVFSEQKNERNRLTEKSERDYVREQKRIRYFKQQYVRLKKSTEYGLE